MATVRAGTRDIIVGRIAKYADRRTQMEGTPKKVPRQNARALCTKYRGAHPRNADVGRL